MIAVVAEESGNAKLSANNNVSATWVPQVTCPVECPLFHNGCYAEQGRSGLHTWRLNKKAKAQKKSKSSLIKLLARQEAKGIRALSGKRKLRVHVLGDSSTSYAANLIGRAMIAHEKKHNKSAWTYTHAFRTVPRKAWQGANVLASCESPEDVKLAKEQGYEAAALVVPPHPTNKIYEYRGLKVLPCPAQFKQGGARTVTCEFCNICQRPDMLAERGLVVGFAPDGQTTKRVLRLIEVRNGTNCDRATIRSAGDNCGGPAN